MCHTFAMCQHTVHLTQTGSRHRRWTWGLHSINSHVGQTSQTHMPQIRHTSVICVLILAPKDVVSCSAWQSSISFKKLLCAVSFRKWLNICTTLYCQLIYPTCFTSWPCQILFNSEEKHNTSTTHIYSIYIFILLHLTTFDTTVPEPLD